MMRFTAAWREAYKSAASETEPPQRYGSRSPSPIPASLLIFDDVFKYLARLGIDADLECLGAALDHEGVPEPAAALLRFEFLVGDVARRRSQRDGARLGDVDLSLRCQLLSGIGKGGERQGSNDTSKNDTVNQLECSFHL